MIEAITAMLGLFGAGIFVAHAVEAYLAPYGRLRAHRIRQTSSA
jgi:hypothetical protein